MCLAESINNGNEFTEQDTFPIEQFVDEAGRRVIMLAPLRALGQGDTTTVPIFKDFENGVYTATLPTNFARLITFKLSSWKRSGGEVIYDTDPTYAWQLHPATRGGEEKPVVAITKGGTELEAYSSNSNNASIADFACITYDDADDVPEKPRGGHRLDDRFSTSLLWARWICLKFWRVNQLKCYSSYENQFHDRPFSPLLCCDG